MNKIITADNIDYLINYLKKGIHISDLLPNGYGDYIYELKVVANVSEDDTGTTPMVELNLQPNGAGKAVLTLTFKNIKYSKGDKGNDVTSDDITASTGDEGARAPKLTEENKNGIKVISYDSSTKVLTITPISDARVAYRSDM